MNRLLPHFAERDERSQKSLLVKFAEFGEHSWQRIASLAKQQPRIPTGAACRGIIQLRELERAREHEAAVNKALMPRVRCVQTAPDKINILITLSAMHAKETKSQRHGDISEISCAPIPG